MAESVVPELTEQMKVHLHPEELTRRAFDRAAQSY